MRVKALLVREPLSISLACFESKPTLHCNLLPCPCHMEGRTNTDTCKVAWYDIDAWIRRNW